MAINKEIRDKILKQPVIFCTECGIELQNFCINGDTHDEEAIKKNLAQCKKTGKFKGDFCSKLFIAGDENMENLFNDEQI